MNKVCVQCSIEKPMTEFYPSKDNVDGVMGKCKKCKINDSKERYAFLKEHDPEFAIRERIRVRESWKRLNYRPTAENRKSAIKIHNSKYPEKQAARVRSKRISCPDGFHNHHWSYNSEHYKDIIQLPIDLHNKIHRYMIYDQQFKKYKTMEGKLLETREMHEKYIEVIKGIF